MLSSVRTWDLDHGLSMYLDHWTPKRKESPAIGGRSQSPQSGDLHPIPTERSSWCGLERAESVNRNFSNDTKVPEGQNNDFALIYLPTANERARISRRWGGCRLPAVYHRAPATACHSTCDWHGGVRSQSSSFVFVLFWLVSKDSCLVHRCRAGRCVELVL